ncbi:hypothetical protein TRFO_04712 [Tritrichomonas foetus]|uniref:Uncharacterized protein n=1 Tax=Tritrichomonas foetus TaxID=1144522 RepID=A0A1J4KDP0_9EUKA|nr:hypothetical protein TRFO_04712 [Tritrichomonas foetus]|eukprot:OHT09106.1 hypothetical protein TRFO_04712 [Tritrichomonas foetus]
MSSIDLTKLSIQEYKPFYADLFSPDFQYQQNQTASDFFNNIVKLIPNIHLMPETPTINDVHIVIEQAKNFIQQKNYHFAKMILKNIPHLYIYLNFSSDEVNQLAIELSHMNDSHPDKSYLMYALTILLILQTQPTFNFLLNHVMSIPKHSLKYIMKIFLNDSSYLEKNFALSTFIPSLQFQIPDLIRPDTHFLLPDPIQMLKFINDFNEKEIGYACHVMQLCNHYILSLSQNENPQMRDFLPFLYFVGSSTFSRSCFSRAVYITTQIPAVCDIIVKLLSKIIALDCPTFIEELFLYNVSESFSYIIPFVGNIFYQYLLGNFDELSDQMKMLSFAYCHDLKESANHLRAINNNCGNRVYLYWFYTFFTRFSYANDQTKIFIVRDHCNLIHEHLQRIYQLITSSEKFFDPSIDLLVSATITSVMDYLTYIVKSGQNRAKSFLDMLFDFVCHSLHYIISVPILETPTSIGCELLRSYQSIRKLLEKQPLIVKRCILLSSINSSQYPVLALALSEIQVPIKFLSNLSNLLILSDEPTCFYCLSTLITNYKPSNHFANFMINFLYNIVYINEPRDTNLQRRILSRYFILLCSVFLFTKDFNSFFLNCSQYDAFDNLFRQISKESLRQHESINLQESIIFTLWAIYLNKTDEQFTPFQIDQFFNEIDLYSTNAATALLQTTVNWCKIHKYNSLPFNIPWNNLLKSQAVNISWFAKRIKKYSKVPPEMKNISRPIPKGQSFSLPWKQNCTYSYLLNKLIWNVEFKAVKNDDELNKTGFI